MSYREVVNELDAPPSHAPTSGFIVREGDPQNLESPPDALHTFITPVHQFYVRNHFKQPDLRADAWRLKVEGAVERPFELGLPDLKKLPSHTRISMLECAGNGRVFLSPKENGAQWQVGAVGNAEWTGVLLSDLLDRAGLRAEAVDVVFEGADQGQIAETPKSPGCIHYARSLPLSHARNGDVLLAYAMNGTDLTPAHGFPLRAIVPGWYGMAAVKWLARVIVSRQRFDGYFQTAEYSHWERLHDAPTLVAVTEMRIKSSILSPLPSQHVPANTPYKVRGLAWAGPSEVAGVEFSSDGGQSWNTACLTGPVIRYAWRSWEFEWQPPAPGPYTLMCRATDSEGRAQPMERNPDLRSYEITHVVPVAIQVG